MIITLLVCPLNSLTVSFCYTGFATSTFIIIIRFSACIYAVQCLEKNIWLFLTSRTVSSWLPTSRVPFYCLANISCYRVYSSSAVLGSYFILYTFLWNLYHPHSHLWSGFLFYWEVEANSRQLPQAPITTFTAYIPLDLYAVLFMHELWAKADSFPPLLPTLVPGVLQPWPLHSLCPQPGFILCSFVTNAALLGS